MTKKCNVIFCLSYLEIPEVLTLISSFNSEYIVLTSNEAVYLFFANVIDSSKILKIDSSQSLRTYSPLRLYNNFVNFINCKKIGLGKVSCILNSDVYFFGVAYCEYETWLAIKIATGKKIYYKPAVDMNFLSEKHSLYAVITCMAIKMFYSISTVPLWRGNGYTFSIERFLKSQQNYMLLNVEPDYKTIHKMIDLEFDKKEVLVLLGGEPEGGPVTEKGFNESMGEILDLLIDRLGLEALIVKYHPTFEPKNFPINQIETVPKHIPARIIMHSVRIVIAYTSTGLCEAADDGIVAISLLNLIEPIDTLTRDKCIEYLTSNCSREIHFPSSIEELMLLI